MMPNMSFGLSRGRALDTTGFGIQSRDLPPFDDGRIDPRTWFDHPEHRFELEIGTGKGTFLIQQANHQPDVNFLGVEWAAEFYRYAADRARRWNLTNVKLLHADATAFIRFWCADNVVSVIHLYFSDPWPKKKHHKRRVVQDRTMQEFHRILRAGGELRLVTDHHDLWVWCEEHAARHEELFDRAPFAAIESAEAGEMVGTNFERKYAREERPFYAMTLMKKESSHLIPPRSGGGL